MRIILFVCAFFLMGLLNGMSLHGSIQLDTSWRPVAYLSLIDRFDELGAASYQFLIAEVPLDDQGAFTVSINGLPPSDMIYRLHFCKKGDPISTIMIGGRNENFVHFVANHDSKISFRKVNGLAELREKSFSGHPANSTLIKLMEWRRGLRTAGRLGSDQTRSIHKNQMIDHFSNVIDTSRINIIRLLSFYFLEEIQGDVSLGMYQKVASKLDAKDTMAYQQSFQKSYDFMLFKNQKPVSKNGVTILWIVGVLMLIGLAFLTIYNSVNQQRKTSEKSSDDQHTFQNDHDINQLSGQERKVWELLKDRKSNKEIGQALNIEVSTVKSHVYRIYNKLGIKSRKEVWS